MNKHLLTATGTSNKQFWKAMTIMNEKYWVAMKDFSYLSGSTKPRTIAVHMDPFSISVFQVLIWIFATTTKICTRRIFHFASRRKLHNNIHTLQLTNTKDLRWWCSISTVTVMGASVSSIAYPLLLFLQTAILSLYYSLIIIDNQFVNCIICLW